MKQASRSCRRSFLRRVLGGVCFVPLLDGFLAESLARAETGSSSSPRRSAAARRFVGVYAPHGIARELWVPGPGFDLVYDNCSLQPFDSPGEFGSSFRDRIVVVEGVDLTAGIEAGTVGHEGARVLLTGAAADGRGPSIDQFLAVEEGLGAETPHSSLVLAVGNQGTEIGSNVSYSSGGKVLPKRIDPSAVFDSVFGPLVLPSDPRALERLRTQRRLAKSSLDFLGAQLSALRGRLPRDQAMQLDRHLTAQRELERRVEHFEAKCSVPPRPKHFKRVRTGAGAAPFLDAITDLHVDSIAQAMACDATRFATLFLGDSSRTGLLEGMPEDIHFEVAHRYRRGYGGRPGQAETWLPLARQNRYAYQKVARLMQRLLEQGLLDETVLLVSSDMGDPARHSSRNVPTLLAGGGFPGGRFLRTAGAAASRANNHVLVSIAHALGSPIESFGQTRDPAAAQGPLSGLSG